MIFGFLLVVTIKDMMNLYCTFPYLSANWVPQMPHSYIGWRPASSPPKSSSKLADMRLILSMVKSHVRSRWNSEVVWCRKRKKQLHFRDAKWADRVAPKANQQKASQRVMGPRSFEGEYLTWRTITLVSELITIMKIWFRFYIMTRTHRNSIASLHGRGHASSNA